MKGAIEKTARLIKAARKIGDTIIWIAFEDSHRPIYKKLFFDGRSRGSFHPDLACLASDNDLFFIKNKSDAFSNLHFKQWMSEQKFNKIFFTGYHIHDCIYRTLSTAAQNYPGQCILIRDACGPSPAREHSIKHIYTQLKNYYGGMVCSADRVIGYLNGTHALKAIGFPEQLAWYASYTGCDEIAFYNKLFEADPVSTSTLRFDPRSYADKEANRELFYLWCDKRRIKENNTIGFMKKFYHLSQCYDQAQIMTETIVIPPVQNPSPHHSYNSVTLSAPDHP